MLSTVSNAATVQEDNISCYFFPTSHLQHVNHVSPSYASVCQVCLHFTCKFCQVQLSEHDVTLSDAGQNRMSADVKFTPLEWSLALYSWQRRGFPAELHQLCVNNQGLTCGVKPRNWSDTSERRLPPSVGGKTLHGASEIEVWGGAFHTHA